MAIYRDGSSIYRHSLSIAPPLTLTCAGKGGLQGRQGARAAACTVLAVCWQLPTPRGCGISSGGGRWWWRAGCGGESGRGCTHGEGFV